MKKLGVLSVFIFLAFYNMGYAQLYIGGKIGYNGAKTVSAQSIENILPTIRMHHGVTGGAILGYTFNEFFDLQGELNITQKGFVIKESTGFDLFNLPIEVGLDYRNRFTYLELPILAKGKIGNDKVKGYLAIGPQIGYMIKGRSKAIANVLLPVQIFDRSLNLDGLGFKQFEFSGVAALGAEFNVGIGRLFVEGRYTHGFTDYYKIPIGNTVTIESNIQNRNVSGSIGMLFPIGTGESGTTTRTRGTRF